MFTIIVIITCVIVPLSGWKTQGDIYGINPRIINGYDARPHQFPWHVGLSVVRDDVPPHPGFSCGGAILDKTHVLTAGHCVQALLTKHKLDIGAGAHNSSLFTEPNRQVVRVCRIKLHPLYRKGAWDFALLTLSKPLVFNHAVRPIRLPPDNIDVTNLTCIVTGWGDSRNNTSDTIRKRILQAVNVTMIDSEECKSLADKIPEQQNDPAAPDFNTYVCSKPDPEGRASCVGDSGGPLACFDSDGPFLLGVVSFGEEDCQRGGKQRFGTAFSKVPVAKDWITCKS